MVAGVIVELNESLMNTKAAEFWIPHSKYTATVPHSCHESMEMEGAGILTGWGRLYLIAHGSVASSRARFLISRLHSIRAQRNP